MKNDVSSRVLDVIYGKYIIDFEKNVIDIDEGFTNLTGYTKDDINKGLHMTKLIPLEDLDYYNKRVVEILSVKFECYLKHRIVKKSGEKVYVLCYGKINDDGTSDIIIADVTSMVNYEEIYQQMKYMLNTVIENVPSGIAMYEILPDNSIQITLANDYYWKKLGYDSEIDLLQNAKNIKSTFTNYGYNEITQKVNEMLNNKLSSFESEYKLIKKDGSFIWVTLRFKVYSYNNQDKNPIIYAVMSDITKLKEQLATINYQNERYKLIQNLTNEIYFTYDLLTDTLTLPKNVYTVLSSRNKSNMIGNFFKVFTETDIIYPDDKEKFYDMWDNAFKTLKSGIVEFRIKLYDDNEYQWCKFHYMVNQDLDGNPVGLFGKIINSNENHLLKDEIKRNQDVIETLSSKDIITKLENKTSFARKFDAILPTLDLNDKCCAIISVDINNFSYINDNFGYDEGNNILIEYAHLISQQGFYILNCRIYSDFFYCLAYTGMSKEQLIDNIKSMHDNFDLMQKQKYPVGDVSLCAGIFFIDDNSMNSIVCMDNCDLARRSIKKDKSVKLAIYSEKLRDNRSKEKAIPSELNEAIQNEMIEVFLQPKFDMKTFKIIGAEALSRWRNEDGSYRSPVTFIPILERLGYVVQLDFYVYEQVLKTMKKWKDNGIKLIPISINFSRIHNNYENFVDRVLELANRYQIDKSLIEIEITESAFADNDAILLNNIKNLRSFGFKVDIDDFGIGESSLSTLLDVPVDIIKLDKKFIDNLQFSKHQQNFLKQLCLLIQTANKHIIFEGVELKEQSNFLCNCGFYMAQGWLFDKAIPIKEFERKYIY